MKFKILCEQGDQPFDYDDLEIAEIKFEELKGDGLLPMVVDPDTGKHLPVKKFDPDAETIIWAPSIMGG